MFLIKNDPDYKSNGRGPSSPTSATYGSATNPAALQPLANDGNSVPSSPKEPPSASSAPQALYKRETFPNGMVRPGEVTGTCRGTGRCRTATGRRAIGAARAPDEGLYTNDQIHAIRILAMEPTTRAASQAVKSGRLFYNHAESVCAILAEIPVRKFDSGKQPTGPGRQPTKLHQRSAPALP